MAFSLGDLFVDLATDNKQLESGLRSAEVSIARSVTKMGREAEKLSVKFTKETQKASRSIIGEKGLEGALKNAGRAIRATRSDISLMAEPLKLVGSILTGPIGLGLKVFQTGLGVVGSVGKVVTGALGVGFKIVGSAVKAAASAIGSILKGALNGILGIGRGVISLFTDGFKRIASIFTNLGQAALRLSISLTALGAAGTAAFAGIAGAAAEFEQEATNTAAVSGLMGAAFDQGREKIKAMAIELGETTVFTAREAASAMTDLARKGFRPVNLAASDMRPLLTFAAAAATDLQTSTQLTTSTLNVFGLTMKDSGRVTDVFAKAITSTAANVEFFTTSMSFVGPIAKSAGLSLEEITAALGFLADRGVRASTAGTSLRKAISSLVKPTRGALEALNEMGLSTKDVDLRAKGLAGVLETLRDAGLDTEKAFKIFGLRAAPAISALVGIGESAANSTEAFRGLQTELEKSGGTAERVAEQQLDTLSGQFTLLKSAAESSLLLLGDLFTPALRKLVGVVRELVLSFNDWIRANDGMIKDQFNALIDGVIKTVEKVAAWVSQNRDLIVQFVVMAAKAAAVAAALGPVLLIVSGMLSGVGGVTRAIALLITTALNPLVLVISAIIAAFKASGVTFDDVQRQFSNFMDGFRTQMTFAEGTVDFWTKLWTDAGATLRAIWEGIKQTFGQFIFDLGETFKIFNQELNDDSVSTWEAIKTVITNSLGSVIAAVLNFANSVLEPFGLAVGSFESVSEAAFNFANAVVQGISSILSWLNVLMADWGVWEAFTKLTLTNIRISILELWNFITNALRGIGEDVVGSGDSWGDWGELIRRVLLLAQRKFGDAKIAAIEFLDVIKQKFDAFVGIVDSVITKIEGLISIIMSIPAALPDFGFGGGGDASGGGGGGGLGTALDFAADPFGAIFANAFADGVKNFRGGTALVGEKGPELVQLPRGSNVIPNDQLGGGGVAINFNGPVNIRSRADVDNLAEQINRSMFFTQRRQLRQAGI